MLKITYTDAGLRLEQIAQTVEAMVAQRTVLTVRLGGSVVVQPTYASLPLPADLPEMAQLQQLAQQTGAIALDQCDSDRMGRTVRRWLEVTLHGVWIADASGSEEGIFVTELDSRLETQLLRLWQQSQSRQHSASGARRRR